MEEGTTTTPFSMMLINQTSRFHVAMAAVKGAKPNAKVQVKRQELLSTLDHAIKKANVMSRFEILLIDRNTL
jgi:xylulose-5-phosphate/fructose-6-phosphate phosphoketolase